MQKYGEWTPLQWRDDCVIRAKEAEEKADRRAKFLRKQATVECMKRRPGSYYRKYPDQLEIDAENLALHNQGTDPIWGAAVGANQWYIQQAIMWGTVVTGDALLKQQARQ